MPVIVSSPYFNKASSSMANKPSAVDIKAKSAQKPFIQPRSNIVQTLKKRENSLSKNLQ